MTATEAKKAHDKIWAVREKIGLEGLDIYIHRRENIRGKWAIHVFCNFKGRTFYEFNAVTQFLKELK